MDDPFLGKKIAEYTVGELFAQGGQGNVYTIRENPKILLKIFHNLLAIDRAKREIAALKTLQHPGFVKIIKSGKYNGYPYFSMEYIPGKSLKAMLENLRARKEALPVSRSLMLSWKIADAMAFAHEKGIVHRDLKPENIMMSESDQPVIIDLGLVRQSGARTLTSTMIGTPLYMAPEQIKNVKGSEPQIDIYAMGTILYELLTGHWPLAETLPEEAGMVEICNLILNVQPIDPGEYVQITPETARICLKCLEKDPARRYPTAEGLRADLWPEVLVALKSEAMTCIAQNGLPQAVEILERAMRLKGYDSSCGYVKEFLEQETGKKLDIYQVEDERLRKRYHQCRKEAPEFLLPVVYVSHKEPYVVVERAICPAADKIEEGFLPLEDEIFEFLENLRRACSFSDKHKLPLSLAPKDICWESNARFSLAPEETWAIMNCGQIMELLEEIVPQPPPLFERLFEMENSAEPLEKLWGKVDELRRGYEDVYQIEKDLSCRDKRDGALQNLIRAYCDKREVVEALIGNARLVEILRESLNDQELDLSLYREVAAVLGKIAGDALGKSEDIAALIEMLKSKEEKSRYNAAATLAKIQDRRIVPPLLKAFRRKESWPIRQTILQALEKNGWTPSTEEEEIAVFIVQKNWDKLRKSWKAAMPALLYELKVLDRNWQYLSLREVKGFIEMFGDFGDERAVPALVGLLKHTDQLWIRRSAAMTLGNIGSTKAVGILKNADLEDEDWSIVVAALAEIGDKRAIPALFKTLSHPHENCRKAAVAALGKMGVGDKNSHKILEMLADKQWQTRRAAAFALGAIADNKAVPVLVKALRDESAEVRKAAVSSLGKIGDSSAVPVLLESLKEGSLPHDSVLLALGDIKKPGTLPTFYKFLKDRDPAVRAAAIEAIGKMGDQGAAPKLKQVLEEPGTARDKVIEALANLGDPHLSPLILKALQDKEAPVCKAAIQASGKMRVKSAVPLLLKLLREKDSPKEAVIEALANIGDESAVPKFIRILQSGGPLAPVAASALGKQGDRIAVPALLLAAKDASRPVREAAISALAQMQISAAVPLFLEALSDPNRFVREAAILALGNVQSEQALPQLVKALKDHEASVRKAAGEVLQNLGWKPSGEREKILHWIARGAWDRLVEHGEAAVEDVLDVFSTWEGADRLEAAKILVAIGLSEGHRKRVRAFIHSEDPELRKTAALTAGKLKDKRAIPALTKALQDQVPEVREAAKRALGFMGQSSAGETRRSLH